MLQNKTAFAVELALFDFAQTHGKTESQLKLSGYCESVDRIS